MIYIRQYRRLGRNARLYLIYACFAGGVIPGGLVFGIWQTAFNLYLVRIGYDLDFVGSFQRVEWLGHGLLVFPFGLLADAIGRRFTFIFATLIGAAASGLLLTPVDPTWLLILSFILGAGRGAHGVAGAPFMADNSDPEERPLLFSLAQVLSTAMFMVGSLIGGYLPPLFGSGEPTIGGFRLALFTTIPLLIVGLIPIYLVNERFVRTPFKGIARNIQSFSTIGLLVLTTGLTAIGLGFVLPLFNVFFAGRYEATVTQVGIIFALGGLFGLIGSLCAPMLTRRYGRVNTIFWGQIGSGLVLVLMGLSPVLWPAAVGFMLRHLFFGVAQPIRALFAMEVVRPEERASTEGLTHFIFDFPAGITVGLAGEMMARGNFSAPYLIATVLAGVAALIFLAYFRSFEAKRGEPALAAHAAS